MAVNAVRHWCIALVVLFCLILSPFATAQEDDGSPPRIIAGEVIEEVVVTARRREERLADVPMSATVYTDQLLQELAIHDLYDVQFQAPNLLITPFPAVGADASISMRGQSQFEPVITLDPAVGIYVDGVYLGRSTAALLNFLDLERVEVLMGPQGTLYGRNTTGGVINLISKKNTNNDFGGFVKLNVGNFNRADVSTAISAPIVSDKLAARIAFRGIDRDGYGRNTLLAEDLDDEHAQSWRLNISLAVNEKIEILFSADSTRQSERSSFFKMNTLDTAVRDPDCLTESPPLFGCLVNFVITDDEWSTALEGDQRKIRSDVSSRHKIRVEGVSTTVTAAFDRFSLRSITAYRSLERRNINDIDGTEWLILNPDANADQHQFSQEFQLFGEQKGFDWVAGVFYFDESGSDNTVVVGVPDLNPSSPSTILPSGENTSFAGFGHITYSLGDRTTLSAGARYTEERRQLIEEQFNASGCTLEFVNQPPCQTKVAERFDDWSYSLSIDRRFGIHSMIYAAISRGSKSGGFNARASKEIEFEPFDPEIVTSYEIGLKTNQLANRFQLNVAYFYDDYRDIQRARLIALSQTEIASSVSNAASAYVTGGELRMSAIPLEGLIWDATVGLTIAQYRKFDDIDGMGNLIDKSDLDFPKTPRLSVTTRLNYQLPLELKSVTKLQAAYSWRDDTFSDVNNSSIIAQDAFGLLDLRISTYWDEWNLEFALTAKNITDELYLTDGLDFSDQFGYSGVFLGPPRTYFAELNWTFGAK